MSGDHEGEFDATYWENRYRNGGGASRRDPSPSLLAETADLAAGAALDAGCGWGADAMWLAARGWSVTAVDVSPAAVGQAQQAAEVANPEAASRVTWLPADLTTWTPGDRFDLVSSHYVHVPGPQEVLFARLASWVAPGGTLLVVGHGYTPGQHGHGSHLEHEPESPADTARVRLAQITSALPEAEWQIVVAEPRTHTISRPNGGARATLHDVVVRARRSGRASGG